MDRDVRPSVRISVNISFLWVTGLIILATKLFQIFIRWHLINIYVRISILRHSSHSVSLLRSFRRAGSTDVVIWRIRASPGCSKSCTRKVPAPRTSSPPRPRKTWGWVDSTSFPCRLDLVFRRLWLQKIWNLWRIFECSTCCSDLTG